MKRINLRVAHKVAFIGLLLFSGVISLSCSTPSEADATKTLEAYCRDYSNLCKVNSLRKTDGYIEKESDSGIRHYYLKYEAELECLKVNIGGYIRTDSPVLCGRIGEIKKVKGVFEYIDTAKGWQELRHLDRAPDEIKE